VLSGGEKSSAIHLPLFAAANAQYGSAQPTCPRMIALDEAFAGIDAKYRPDLLELTVKFDLDLFMTGHDLWVTYPCIPQIAHYDLHHDKLAHTVSTMLLLWDGTQILDDATFPNSEDLAAAVVGIKPSRYSPDDLETPALDDPEPSEADEE
jgi:energy-coupling factor transporter ATP-binding protein EcfA2